MFFDHYAIFETVRRRRDAARARRELVGLSDRTLKDIGLTRGDITMIVADIRRGVDPDRR